MAPIKRCSFCKRPGLGPVATAYWRWFPNGTDGVGYRVYYCNGCWKSLTTSINLQLAMEELDMDVGECTICGTNPGQDRDLCYLYLYPPRSERMDLIVQCCGNCLNHVVRDVREHGQKLEDRDAKPVREVVAEAWSVIPAA